MVHLDDYSLLASYSLFQMTIPDTLLLELDQRSLPKDWRADPAPLSTAQIGDDWLLEQSSLALYVPSTIMSIENNILLNPKHPDYTKVLKTIKEVDFSPDPRL